MRIAAALLVASILARADEGWGETVSGLTVGLEPERASWKEGEVMTFTVRVRNDGKEPVALAALDREWILRLTFDATDGGESFFAGARLCVDYASQSAVTVKAGETWSAKAVLHEGGYEFLRVLPDRKPGDDWDYRRSIPAGRYRAWIPYENTSDDEPELGKLWTGRAVSRAVPVTIEPRNGAAVVRRAADIATLPPDARAVRATNLDDADVALLAERKGLEDVDLSWNVRLTDEALRALEPLAKTRVLDLSHCAGLKGGSLAPLAELPALEELRLYQCGLDDAALAGLKGCKSLRTIVLGGAEYEYDSEAMNDIGDEGLAAVCRITSLRRLVLRWGRFTPDGLEVLRLMPELKELDLHGCRLKGEHVEAIAALDVEVLDIGDNDELVDDALKPLVKMQGLRSLGLSDSGGITDAGLEALRGLKELKELDLRDCRNVTDEGVAKLQRALPGCKIAR